MRGLRAGVIVAGVGAVFGLARTAGDPYITVIALSFVAGTLAGLYLGVVLLLTLLAAVFSAHRLRRAVARITPHRVGRWVAGIALLGGVASPQAHGFTDLSAQEVTAQASDDVAQFVERLGLGGFDGDVSQELAPSVFYTVEPGDSFWRIAEQHVSLFLTEASIHVVATYWLAVIEANFAELVESGNPDFLLPVQVLTLPPVNVDGPL